MIVLRSLVGAIVNARAAALPVADVLVERAGSGRAMSRCTCSARTA